MPGCVALRRNLARPVAWRVAEAPALYRPRRPERTSFYQLLDEHFEPYAREHSERYAPRHGDLRHVVRRCVEQFLDCGRYESGFARLRCTKCRVEHLIAFSCQTRNFCPSCQAKRAALFAEHFVEVIRLPVPHRHMVFTIPKALRGLFERDRRLLSILSRAAYDALRTALQGALGRRDALPGTVASIQTFGSYGNWHPHIHALVTDGLIERGGGFLPLGAFPVEAIEQRFRELVLKGLHRAERLSEGFMEALLSWEHSGFSVHVGTAIEANDPHATERVSRYVTRAPFALAKVHPQKDGGVRLLTPPDPKTGLDYRLFDPLDWVHAVTTQIPDARQHMVRYYGAYANRARRLYRAPLAEPAAGKQASSGPRPDEDEQDLWVRARRRSWARLIARIYEVDPLVCPRCGDELKVVAAITDPRVIDRILEHRRRVGLRSPFEPRAPPAA
ncbi:MAG: transposase [Planctomycetota bacterium]|nr:transposase [Planctomycetota bacterium]